MSTIIARAAESVHWYSIEGDPKYTVKAKDGKDRPTTLRDARKLNLVPSVTTILKVAAKPALEAWKMEQMLLAALTLPRGQNESEKSFIDRVVADSKEAGKQAAERGTRIHESVEKWYRGDKDVEHAFIADRTMANICKHFNLPENAPWAPEASFGNENFGGKVDLSLHDEDLCSGGLVVDFKTKEFDFGDKVAVYDEHLMQLAAYRVGLGLPKARCANAFISTTNVGLVHIHEWSDEELERGWSMFECLMKYWRLKNKFGEEYADK